MRAARYYGARDLRVEDVPDPHPAADELLLRVIVTGVCGTDAKEWASGPYMFPIETADPATGHRGPMIPGHEIAGRVVAIGEGVQGFTDGALVVSGAGISCGRCSWCRRGSTNLCERYATVGLQRDGGLAEFVAVPARTCVDIAEYELTPDVAALAQPMSIGVHAMRKGRLEQGDVAVVIGIGAIGTFVTHAAVSRLATVVAVDVDKARLEQAARLGVTHVVDPTNDIGLGGYLAEHDLMPTVIYEASGTTVGLASALDAATRGTRLVAIGLQGAHLALDVLDLTLREIELIGSNAHVFAADLAAALDLLAAREAGWSDVAPIAIPLDAVVEGALEPIANGTTQQIKTLIDPWASAARATAT